MADFLADGGFGAMTGVNLGVGRQSEQLGADALEQALEAAAGEIRAADRAAEQRIARDDPIRLGNVKADAGWGVARCFKHFKGVAAKSELHTFGQRVIDGGFAGSRKPEYGRLLVDRVIEILLTRMHVGRDIQRLFHFGEGADVIEVSMGDQNRFDFDLETVDLSKDDTGFVAGIDEKSFFGFFVREDRAILLEQ